MSSTSQPTTFEDLYTDLANVVRVNVSQSDTLIQLKRYINICLHDMHVNYQYKFPWCERQSTLITMAPYTTGTVSIPAGSTTLTGSGTAWNTVNTYNVKNMRTGGKVTIAGSTDIYRVASVSGDTSATLSTRYVASSDASAAEYRYFEDAYGLATDFLRPVDQQIFSDAWGIPLIDRTEFRRRYPRPNIPGKPQVACILDEGFNATTTPVRKIVFHPYPDAAYVIPYAYVSSAVGVDSSGLNLTSLSATSDEPIVPLRYRHCIVLGAAAAWFRNKRDDARADAVQAQYVDLVTRIVADHDVGSVSQAKIQPGGNYWGKAKRPYTYRGGSRIYDLNDEFDSFRR
jgi:hypothetical protein